MLSADQQGVSRGTEIIRSFFEENGVRNARTVLLAEEAMLDLVQHTEENSQLSVSMKRFLGTITVEISAKGEEYHFGDRLIVVIFFRFRF